jgi:pimeloyl-ACP methyl ester carboxylesterase
MNDSMQSRYLEAGGLRIHYRMLGSGSPLICLHGWPETSHEWERIAPMLATRYRVIAPDTRGHGQTEAPGGGYDRAQLARDVVMLMDALGIERAPVLAHDWGGIIACKLALDHGSRVERLVMMDTICTGWPTFVTYFYWFFDGDRAERFFARYGRAFIESIVGGRPGLLPAPPECPIEFQSAALTAPAPWATAADLDTYALPFERGHDGRVSIAYYRNLEFHRVIADAGAPHGERYEHVDHATLGRMWRDGTAGREYLDYAPEDRHKVYAGPTLWLYGAYLLQAAGARLDARGLPTGDPSFDSFPRHFPNLKAVAMPGGHFFVEEHPQKTSDEVLAFLSAGDITLR